MRYIFFVIKSAILDFSRNKVRTLLTSLGIMIGVLSVVLIVAFGLGLKASINDQFESLGANQLILFPGQVLSNGQFRNSNSIGSTRFDERDYANIKRLKSIKYVVPTTQKTTLVNGNGREESGDIYAAPSDIFPARSLEIQSGRAYEKEDDDGRRKVAVLGAKMAEKLFDEPGNAIGKNIKMEGSSFKVIGVLEEVGGGGFGGPDFDNFIYIPMKTGYIFNPDKKFLTMILKAEDTESNAQAKADLTTLLTKRYKADDFQIVELTEIQGAVTDIFGILNFVLVGIAAISLIVGGIGIMNIMYVTVTERIKEIGVRRALGARRGDILAQFLVEAILLSLFGGLLGLFLAVIIVYTIIVQFLPAYINWQSVVVALGVSSAIGVVFGVFPARRASQLSPIEAIRYE